jgi:hypothetical protein
MIETFVSFVIFVIFVVNDIGFQFRVPTGNPEDPGF